MMIDIKPFVELKKKDLISRIEDLGVEPLLIVHQVGDNPASNAYIKGKMKDCAEVGIKCIVEHYPEDATAEDVQRKVNLWGMVPQILQLPVPFDENEVVFYKESDVDGFRLDSRFDPCTPKGIMMWLEHNHVNLKGKNVVIFGRSNIVGKPLARMMTDADATVTLCHSKTEPFYVPHYCKTADIIVSAVGKANWLNPGYCCNQSAIIIDVGINYVNGKMCGDVHHDHNLFGAYITPVPGGVGLLTRLALLENTVSAYEMAGAE